jgi:hypothetical protein
MTTKTTVSVRSSNYEGLWPRGGFVATWLWEWKIARPYLVLAGLGILVKVCLIIWWWSR